MFNFFKFSQKNLLPNELNSMSIVEHMRRHKIKQKDFELQKTNAYIIVNHPAHYYPIQHLLDFINTCLNYSVYTVIKNRYDLDFYIEEVKTIAKHGSPYCGKQQLEILVSCLNTVYPVIISFMEYQTAIETERKNTIEKAGLTYTRHIYPDYRGCDELFYDYPSGSEDSIYETAKTILKNKKS